MSPAVVDRTRLGKGAPVGLKTIGTAVAKAADRHLGNSMAIWIEQDDIAVWHRVSSRVMDGQLGACGWRMNLHRGRNWMQKADDLSSGEERCDG